MTRRRLIGIGMAAIVGLNACAGMSAPAYGDPDLITRSEADDIDARNAYEAIERLRPRWLAPRTDRSVSRPTTIAVYQDATRLGDVETLRDIPIETFTSIRWLDSAEAGRLPGLGSVHVEGAIVVSTRSEPR